MQKLYETTVEKLLKQLKPSPFESYKCNDKVREKLHKLHPDNKIITFGTCGYRVDDVGMSYFIEDIIVLK